MNPFLQVIKALNQQHVRYVIVGGFAAVMHGHHRSTHDLDIVVDLAAPEARKAIDALLSIGMQCRVPVDPYSFADAEQRAAWMRDKGAVVFTMLHPAHPLFVVDLFVEPPLEWSGLYQRAATIRADDVEFRVCALDDLIEMKMRSGRPQDLVDIEVLKAIRSER